MTKASRINSLGQPIGGVLDGWTSARSPGRIDLRGRTCFLTPADPEKHAESLWDAIQQDSDGRMWTYLSYGPFCDFTAYKTWMTETCLGRDPLFFAIVETASKRAIGLSSYLRIAPEFGVIEVGHLQFTPLLQRTTAATEAMFLMMEHAFEDLGYRRYEWKCDALNAPSRHAAERLGFQFEGVFRQATHYKGRNRDTAWYSILDSEWPRLRAQFIGWLDETNFDAQGNQITPLRCDGSTS
jgi:RimJ/RimL family protein N-acetyltransferase